MNIYAAVTFPVYQYLYRSNVARSLVSIVLSKCVFEDRTFTLFRKALAKNQVVEELGALSCTFKCSQELGYLLLDLNGHQFRSLSIFFKDTKFIDLVCFARIFTFPVQSEPNMSFPLKIEFSVYDSPKDRLSTLIAIKYLLGTILRSPRIHKLTTHGIFR